MHNFRYLIHVERIDVQTHLYGHVKIVSDDDAEVTLKSLMKRIDSFL